MKPRAKILLVDDKPANLLALEAVLGDEHYKLLRAASGFEALELLLQHSDIVLILLDVQMPGMDGFETATRIKQLPDCADIPIIFITAIYHDDPFVKKGYQAGAIDYFGKPFDPEILRLKVGIYAAFRQKAHLLKQREQQVKESEELLRTGRKLAAILEALTVGVVIADPEGRICQTNEEVLKILNSVEHTKADSYGVLLAWWEGDGRLLKRKDGPLMQALNRGRAARNETVALRCLDGSEKSVFVSASPLRGLDRRIVGAVIVLQDMTQHKLIEKDLEEKIVHLVSLGVELEGTTNGSR